LKLLIQTYFFQEKVSSLLDLEIDRACEWCSSPDYMRSELPCYVDKPLDEWKELLLDLCYCYDCVQEYHRLAEELIETQPSYKKVKTTCDLDVINDGITWTICPIHALMPSYLENP